jgi:uncharacterized protein YceK
MKKNVFVLISVAILLTGCSCERAMERKAIKEVAYEYSYALGNYRLDDAAKYATTETQKRTLPTAKAMMKMVDSTYIASDTPAEIVITNVRITSDTSATAYWHKTTPRKDLNGTLELRKRNGVWQAHDLIKQAPARKPATQQPDQSQNKN